MSTKIKLRLQDVRRSLFVLFSFFLLCFALNTLKADPDDTKEVTLTNENPCKIIYNSDECEEVRVDLSYDGEKGEYCVEATANFASGNSDTIDVLSDEYPPRAGAIFNGSIAK